MVGDQQIKSLIAAKCIAGSAVKIKREKRSGSELIFTYTRTMHQQNGAILYGTLVKATQHDRYPSLSYSSV